MTQKEIIEFVFLDIAIVIIAARLMGRLFQRIRQPAVVGEILAGILLGPTLLGLFPGDLHVLLFPEPVRPYLTVIAQIGLVLFMFIVGLEVDLSLIKERRRVATTVSLTSIALPFGLGLLLATVLYSQHETVRGVVVPPVAFALFLGAAMSITAFPVLARILTEREMQRTPTGVLALACAAIDDVVAWSLLAVVIAVTVGGNFTGVGLILLLTVMYALIMFLVVRPLLETLVQRYRAAGRLTPGVLTAVLAGMLLSAYVTDLIGVHAILGAFVFGAVMPRSEVRLTREVLERLEQVSLLLLLPVFFVVAGLQVDVRGVGVGGLVELVLILVVAIGGKFLGATAAARLQRIPQRQAAALGVLMNTRGLTEIVILQVGAQLGVLDPELFTLMVIMALTTTIMTEPLLRFVYPDRIVRREIAAAERAELGEVDAFTVLIAVPGENRVVDNRQLAELGRGMLGREQPARVVLCRLLPAPAVPLELASGLGTDLAMIAAAGDDLRVLARELEADGARSSVVARFSADPAADLAALAARLEADVVVVSEPRETAADSTVGAAPTSTLEPYVAALPEVGEAALAVVRLAAAVSAGPPGVAVLTDGGAGARTALRLGGQFALHHGAAVAVGAMDGRRAGRRVGAAVQALQRRGIDACDLPVGGAFDVLLLPVGAAEPKTGAATAVVRVRPAAADVDENLDQVLARIATGA